MTDHPWFQGLPPLFAAGHRGTGLCPENTIVAYEAAFEAGAHALEMDIRLSADGRVMVIHDETVDRTTEGRGRVSAMSAKTLRDLDAGYRYTDDAGRTHRFRGKDIRIPFLEEVLERFPKTKIILEIKGRESSIVEPLVRILRQKNAEQRVMVSGFNDVPIFAFRNAAPAFATGACLAEVRRFYLLSILRAERLLRPVWHALQVPVYYGGLKLVTGFLLRAARRSGLPVHVWTVNDRKQMHRLLRNGVSGLITDHPRLAVQVLQERSGPTGRSC